jgi:hypothetical protein
MVQRTHRISTSRRYPRPIIQLSGDQTSGSFTNTPPPLSALLDPTNTHSKIWHRADRGGIRARASGKGGCCVLWRLSPSFRWGYSFTRNWGAMDVKHLDDMTVLSMTVYRMYIYHSLPSANPILSSSNSNNVITQP